MDQIPSRTAEPGPHDWTETTDKTPDYYDVALGSLWGWQNPQDNDALPGHLRDSGWERSFWRLPGTEGDIDGRVFGSGLFNPPDEQIPRRLQDADKEPLLQQGSTLGQGLHYDELGTYDLLLDGDTRAEDSLLPQDLFHY